MGKLVLTALALAAGICAGALLGGCGSSSTKTVSVAGTPPSNTQGTAASATTTTATSKQPSATATTGPPSTTRTATEPAFTPKEETASGAAGAAAAVVRSQGYTPSGTSLYHSNQTLRVLLGKRTGAGYQERAFFFIGERFIGTDTSAPSASLSVLSQSDTAVTLGYPLYRHGDSLCCPSGGQASVRFELNNGKLAPAGAIPPASSAAGLSRQ